MKKITIASLIVLWAIQSLCVAQNAQDFYETGKIQRINITFRQQNWPYLLDSLRYNGEEMLLGKIDINGQAFEDVGIRYSDARSVQVGSKRNNFEIFLDFIKNGQHYSGIRQLKLSMALRDPSMVREVVGYEIYRKYMPGPRANFAELTVNNEPVGLFVNVEVVDLPFLSYHYGESFGALYKSAPKDNPSGDCLKNGFGSLNLEKSEDCYANNFKDITETGYGPLYDLSRTLHDKPSDIHLKLNVDQVLWMLALNNVMVNLYSYSGRHSENYYLYQDGNGIFHPVVGDLNLCFGSYKNTGVASDLKLKELQEMDVLLHEDDQNFPLISQLLKNPQNKKIYLSHAQSIYKAHFSEVQYLERVKELQKIIEASFAKDPYKSYSVEDFKNSLTTTIGERSQIPGIEELMEKRANYLRKYREFRNLPPSIEEVQVQKREQFSSQKINEFRITAKVGRFPEQVKVMYRFDASKNFMETSMNDDGQSHDGEAKDGVYGVAIQPEAMDSVIEFYIVSENLKAIGFSPKNYVKELHHATLEEINR